VKFQQFYKHQLGEIRKQVAVYGDDGHITAYKGNTTDMRARKRIRALAREVARLAMKEIE
jgi:hypothetical protein